MIPIDILYVDLDGVLVDFERGVADTIKEYMGPKRGDLPENLAKIMDEMGRLINGGKDVGDMLANKRYKETIREIVGMDTAWWTRLEWMPDGKILWETLKKYNPVILSSPFNKTYWEEKRTWVTRELGADVKVIIEDDKEVHATPTSLLIDDRPKHSKFKAYGGHTLKHINAENTIDQLKNYDLSKLTERKIFDFDTFVNENYNETITPEEIKKFLESRFHTIEGKSEYEIMTHDREENEPGGDEEDPTHDVSFEFKHYKKEYVPAEDVIFIDTVTGEAYSNYENLGYWSTPNELVTAINKYMRSIRKSIFG